METLLVITADDQLFWGNVLLLALWNNIFSAQSSNSNIEIFSFYRIFFYLPGARDAKCITIIGLPPLYFLWLFHILIKNKIWLHLNIHQLVSSLILLIDLSYFSCTTALLLCRISLSLKNHHGWKNLVDIWLLSTFHAQVSPRSLT